MDFVDKTQNVKPSLLNINQVSRKRSFIFQEILMFVDINEFRIP